MNKVLEKQLLAIIEVIKKMQKKLDNTASYDKEIKELQDLINAKEKATNKQLDSILKTIEQFNNIDDTNTLTEEINALKTLISNQSKNTNVKDEIDKVIKDYATKNDLQDILKEVKIEKIIETIKEDTKFIEPKIKIGKVTTIQAGEEVSVDLIKKDDTYILNFNIPRGVSGRGMPGKGVVSGGTTNQVLAKNSNDDYDTKWVTGGGGGTSDHSELTNLDYASAGHTGFQPAGSYIEDASYVHTDNNFTDVLETKLTGIEAGAEVNVQSDWNQTTNTADDYIKNKPTIPSTYTLPIATTTVLGGVKVDGSTITSDINGVISAVTGGSGDVTGPAGATADDIALFDGSTGKIIKDSTKKLSDLQPAGTYSTDIHANITALNAVSGTNTGNQAATDFDIKDLTDSTSLRTTWSCKQDALGFAPENASNKKLDLTDNSDTYYPSQKAVKTAVDGKVAGNVAIVAGTKTKISYDTKGLVTSGADATTADIADSTNKRYVSDAQLTVIGNTSNTNTGDQTSIVGITGTKAQFDTACSDGNFLYSGDITQYTDELAQDAIGSILTDTTEIDFTYDDATPKIEAAIKNASITYAKIQNISATDRILGRDSAGAGTIEEITPANVIAMLKSSLIDLVYPVGSVYETTSTNLDTTTKMATQFGGTWEDYGSGRVLVGKSADTEFDTIDKTGGSKYLQTHTHDIPYNIGAGGYAAGYITAANSASSTPQEGWAGVTTVPVGVSVGNSGNIQPYIVVYRYRRTA